MVCTKTGKVLTIADDDVGQEILMGDKKGEDGEKFKIFYADDMPPEPKKGDKRWGFTIGEPFYVKLVGGTNRYLDYLGNNMVVKTRNGYKSQQWVFDYETRTIKSYKDSSKSWHVEGEGKGENMEIATTNKYQWF